MPIRHAVFIMLLMMMQGCSDSTAPTDTAVALSATPPNTSSGEDRYPTEEEYAAMGGGGTSLKVHDVLSVMSDATFYSDVIVEATWVNFLTASLANSVVDLNGTQLNAGTRTHTSSVYRPFPESNAWLYSEISTMGRTCGIVGKAHASAQAALKLAYRTNTGQFIGAVAWSDSVGVNGADETRPACDTKGTTASRPSGGGENDGDYCIDWYLVDLMTGHETYIYTSCNSTQQRSDSRLGDGHAQAAGNSRTITATVALVDSLHQGAKSAVLRRAADGYLVLGTAEASVHDWAAAMALLETVSAGTPTVQRDFMAIPKDVSSSTNAWNKRKMNAAKVRMRLPKAARTEIAGFGVVHATTVTVRTGK